MWYDEYKKYLNTEEMLNNAQNIVNYFLKSNKGWKRLPICAILGNMAGESTVNPNMYEHGYDWSEDRGYGLVQWTPRSKFWNWAEKNGFNPKLAETQLKFIDYEIDNGLQWIKTSSFPLSYEEFRKNTNNNDLAYLTKAFMLNYERPKYIEESYQRRLKFANLCNEKLNFEGNSSNDENVTVPDNVGSVEEFARKVTQILQTLKSEIDKDFNINLTDFDNKNYITNGNINIFKYGNIFHLSYKNDFKNKLNKAINEIENQKQENNKNFKQENDNKISNSEQNSNLNIQKVLDKANSFKLFSIPYNMSGSRDMVSSGDCSSFVRICFLNANVDIGTYTGAQYQYAKKNNLLVYDGYSNNINNLLENVKPGDYILMSNSNDNFGAGGGSHVMLVLTNDTIIHQSAYPNMMGPRKDNVVNYVKGSINNGFGRWALVRVFK